MSHKCHEGLKILRSHLPCNKLTLNTEPGRIWNERRKKTTIKKHRREIQRHLESLKYYTQAIYFQETDVESTAVRG